MKAYNCSCIERVQNGLKEAHGYENISLPIEFISGKFYIEATMTKEVKGRQVKRELPILLSRCPFCGNEYVGDRKGETNGKN